MDKRVTIIGGGPVGPVMGIYLKNLGFEVDLYERNPDIRIDKNLQGRSVNLVVTSRGVNTLRDLGLWESIKDHCIPVFGRMIHGIDSSTTYQSYSCDNSHCNYSIPRSLINQLILDLAEKSGINLHFQHKLKDADLKSRQVVFETQNETKTISFEKLVGADGANSLVRKAIIEAQRGQGLEAIESIEDMNVQYKELEMPCSDNGNFLMEKEALHIWPRGAHMLMGLPNLDGTFTMTLYLPKEGEISFANLKTPHDVESYFQQYYPDSIEKMPNYLDEFFHHPVGNLGTVRANYWSWDQAVVIGDAAHGVVPFFGQGMNAGLEDCYYFTQLLKQANLNWAEACSEFQSHHLDNGHAIADMAEENYREMSEKTGDQFFLKKKSLEKRLGLEFPNDYLSRYSMVTHSLIPYALAQKAGVIQDSLLEELATKFEKVDDLDLNYAKKLIDSKFAPFVQEHHLNLSHFQ